MKRQRMKLGSAAAGLLLLLFISVLTQATSATVHANPLCYPDKTGKLCGVFLRPGVRDEFKSTKSVAWSHTLDTLRGTQGGQAQRQQIIDRYQDYAILASMSDSIGDFQFDIGTVANVSDIRIYLPSNFTFAYVSGGYGDATTSDKIYSIWTDITDDYSFISVTTLANDDPIAPGWNRIEIGRIPPIPSPTILPGLYHVRLFSLRAPFTAGLYHFKIYVDGSTIGDGNFPIVIVKSSLQPAYVTGLVLLKGLFPPTNASGRVTATGATDQGKYAEAVGYFGPEDYDTADTHGSYYRYWLFGLPAGTFDLTASASGFLKTSTRVTVDPGQSLRQDFELEKGVQISLTVWSKDQNGPAPWGNLWQPPYGTNNPYLPITDGDHHRDILVRLLDQYEETIGYWASDDIDPPYGPPWNITTIDGKRNYSPLVLKPSTVPSHNSYSMTLTDIRGLPAARLDGNVPANSADFVEGIDTGPYSVEVHVTGYIMLEADDWQRTFTLPSNAKNYSLQVDLRRSRWVNASAVIRDSQYAPISNCTYVVVAKSTDNLDEGIAAWIFKAGAQEASIVLEGFNAAYSYGGSTGTQSVASTAYQDYGLEPVDYTLEVYMADMGTPWKRINGKGWYLVEEEEIQVLPALGSGGIEVSFHLKPCSIEFALRSIQIQVPPQVAPWTFPGAGVRLSIVDELGNLVGSLDPSFYGLIQDAGTTNSTIGWPIRGTPALPGHSFGVSPYDNDNINRAGRHGLLLVRFTGIDPGPINALSGFYPTRIEEGKYSISASTFGYIQRYDYSVNIVPGVGNDLQMDLVQGTQIRVELDFQHESVPTNFNGFVRVEVYDSQDELVGASIYGQAQPNYYTLMGVQSGGYLNYSRSNDFMQIRGPAEGTDFGLPNATRLEAPNTFPSSTGNVGDPLYPADLGFINGQRAVISSYIYSSKPYVHRPIPSGNGAVGVPDTWACWPSMIRSDANRLSVPAGAVAAFDVFGFNSYYGGPDSRMDGLWANGWDTTNGAAHADSGIRGSRDALELDGAGTFTIRVWTFDPYGPNGVSDPAGPDGIFGTDDDYTSPDPIDAGLSDFRAYAQTAEVTGLEAPWGGSAIVRVTLEEQPSLIGTVSWIDMYGDQRPLAWAQVIEASPGNHWASSATGSYRLWLSEGSYDFLVTTIGEEQLWEPYNFDIVFSRPGVHVSKDVTLTVSGTATPEFTNLAFTAAIPMVALLIMSSKRRSSRSQTKR